MVARAMPRPRLDLLAGLAVGRVGCGRWRHVRGRHARPIPSRSSSLSPVRRPSAAGLPPPRSAWASTSSSPTRRRRCTRSRIHGVSVRDHWAACGLWASASVFGRRRASSAACSARSTAGPDRLGHRGRSHDRRRLHPRDGHRLERSGRAAARGSPPRAWRSEAAHVRRVLRRCTRRSSELRSFSPIGVSDGRRRARDVSWSSSRPRRRSSTTRLRDRVRDPDVLRLTPELSAVEPNVYVPRARTRSLRAVPPRPRLALRRCFGRCSDAGAARQARARDTRRCVGSTLPSCQENRVRGLCGRLLKRDAIAESVETFDEPFFVLVIEIRSRCVD